MQVFVKKLIKLISKQSYKFFETNVYYNYKYRPTGIYQTSKEYVSAFKNEGLKCIEVKDECIGNLQVPSSILELIEKHQKSPIKRSVHIERKVVVEVANGRIYSDHVSFVSVISSDNKLIKDVSLDLNAKKDSDFYILKKKYFVKPVKIDGVVFSLLTGGGGVENYFHWLFDALPRLQYLKDSNLFDSVDKFLVPSTKLPYQKESLQLLGIPESKIIRGDMFIHIQADKLILSSGIRDEGLIPEWTCTFLRDSFLKHKDTTKKYPPFVYISRGDAKIRNIANESEIIDLLSKFGFKVFHLRNLKFHEQIALFASAEFIISPHGAGLANLTFCQPGTVVIELFTETWLNGLYPEMSHINGLVHDFLTGKPNTISFNKKHLQQSNYVIDVGSLEVVLKKHLNMLNTVQ